MPLYLLQGIYLPLDLTIISGASATSGLNESSYTSYETIDIWRDY